MKQILIAIAATLVAMAEARAEQVTRAQAAARTHREEDYTANAGGWN